MWGDIVPGLLSYPLTLIMVNRRRRAPRGSCQWLLVLYARLRPDDARCTGDPQRFTQRPDPEAGVRSDRIFPRTFPQDGQSCAERECRKSSGGRGTRTPKGLRPAVFKFPRVPFIQCNPVVFRHAPQRRGPILLRGFASTTRPMCPGCDHRRLDPLAFRGEVRPNGGIPCHSPAVRPSQKPPHDPAELADSAGSAPPLWRL